MKYQLYGIIDAKLSTYGETHPDIIKGMKSAGVSQESILDLSTKRVIQILNPNGTVKRSFMLSLVADHIRPADTALERMINESNDLRYRYNKLGDFLNTEKFLSIDKDQQSLLHRQFSVMYEYIRILEKRILMMTDSK